ncbi:hypothetical protein [Alloyangia pacifica]|uniref:hypothetical protein n=1 Tax=Alloyangia pacifica TaxID=311180 RepID=UPI001CD277E5|nr:hypothetical protein [Alloyangia pacifica]MCA0995110.1 hypothetical protein [Alloyangia pacifica]
MTHPRYLVVSRVGAKSLHGTWVSGAHKAGFDVVLSAYNPIEEPQAKAVIVEQRPGRKVEGYAAFLRDRRELWTQYDYICLMDEDLATDSATLARAFGLAHQHGLVLSQPALTADSYFTYAACLRQPAWQLRYVNFVEMMCPIFRRDAIDKVLPLFEQGLESGIDLVWCNLLSEGPNSFAILDGAAICHTEPVGGNKEANGFNEARGYEDDISKVLDRYSLPWLSAVPYAGLTAAGTRVESRALLFLAALSLLTAVPRRAGWGRRLRFVMTHLRHILMRKPLNLPVRDAAAGETPA